ncbi:hypothetical protein RclHR1_02460009 [Rhizophagus clarus]|uniref:Reverse transcriptase domain-containing protein n=1 Tax=Rhizophagus clarus TaxID=94130 RepID=A0A2Z6QZC8_9GLOM|nr:hypothetical protein RclHR1_02460005 [Rhizophagus clarus]GBB94989.1 hypothetical protein RclHR1_02460009 [Rhizophagus clarus]
MDKTLDYSGPSKLGKRPSNIITCDHNITFAEISFTDIIVTNNRGGRRAERSSTRILYDYENTTNEQWNEYKRHLNSLLEKYNAYSYIEIHRQNENTLNKLWDIICSCKQQAALKHILHKKIEGNKTNINRNYKEMEDSSKERKDLLYIKSIMRKLHKNELKGKKLLNVTKGIKTFNQHYETNISDITENTDWHTWKCETRNWLKIVRRVIKIKDKAIKEATIKKRIEKRNSMITKNQRKMINSILDKTYSKINLDRICVTTITQEEILLNSKEEVKSEAINTFSSSFRLRNHKFENLSKQWKEIYEPKKDIDLKIYEHLNNKPTEQKWHEMLKTTNDKSALTSILSKHTILKGPNYAGLPGESISTPLAIINGILEDVCEENKTLWIVSQDMVKAFDSVDQDHHNVRLN